jgi:CRP-like cAMP-binding protein
MECPWRQVPFFLDHTPAELDFLVGFKTAHGHAAPNTELLREGEPGPRLFTLFSGWAFRSKLLPDGSRQLLDILLPGDLIGLETVLYGATHHSVISLTDLTYCVLDGARMNELFLKQPSLALKVTSLVAQQLRQLELRTTSIGRCDANGSLAVLLLDLHTRLTRRNLVGENGFGLPLTQQQMADALGLTIVHVNRVIRRMHKAGIMTIQNRHATIHDLSRLIELAALAVDQDTRHPLL